MNNLQRVIKNEIKYLYSNFIPKYIMWMHEVNFKAFGIIQEPNKRMYCPAFNQNRRSRIRHKRSIYEFLWNLSYEIEQDTNIKPRSFEELIALNSKKKYYDYRQGKFL